MLIAMLLIWTLVGSNANEDRGWGALVAADLTGVWDGVFSYRLGLQPSTPFVAILIDCGDAISGTIHEQWSSSVTFFASLDRSCGPLRQTYDGGKPHTRPIIYGGSVNGDATRIEGRWKIPGNWSGR
jgi:hypothetical protein